MLASLIPMRLLAFGLAAIAVISVVAGGYAYVGKLQKRITQLEVALATEQGARKTAEAAVEQFERAVEAGQERIDQLEQANRRSAQEWVATMNVIDSLDDCLPTPNPAAGTEPNPNSKSISDAVDSLNRANADVNRMLERIGN